MKPTKAAQGLQPYHPGTPIAQVARQYALATEDIVMLASNENPLGMGQAAQQALQDARADAHRYPEQYQLLQALAARYQVQPEQLVLGNGSNDIIDCVARTYLEPGDEAISSQYAFMVFTMAVQVTGGTNIVVPSTDFGHDVPAMLAAITPRTKLLYIVNPNNPTGTFIPYDTVQQFIEQVPPTVLIVLDEAYYEYLKVGDQADTVRWLSDYPNLIIVRTFSKIHGLAGLRIGYALTSAAVASQLNRVRQTFNTNHLALAAATAALGDNTHVVRSYNVNVKGREQLIDGLAKLGVRTLPAYGNFVTLQHPDASTLCQQLVQTGIIVRPLAPYDMPQWLRVTIGLPEENRRFLDTLASLL